MGVGSVVGGRNFCLAFYLLQSGEKRGSLCPSKLAYTYNINSKKPDVNF